MNTETKLALIAFVDAVEEVIAPVVGPAAYDEFEAVAEQLKKQLNSDETIL